MQLSGVNAELRRQALEILDKSLLVNAHDFNLDGLGNHEAKMLGELEQQILEASIVGEQIISLIQTAGLVLKKIAEISNHPEVVERSSQASRQLFDLTNLTLRGS